MLSQQLSSTLTTLILEQKELIHPKTQTTSWFGGTGISLSSYANVNVSQAMQM